MPIAIMMSLLAGLCFALGGVLQQHAAWRRSPDEALSLRLIGGLARQPLWLAGIAAAALSYVFQAVALHYAPLALVQPLIVTELVFAIPLSVHLGKRRMLARDWAGILLVGGGLAAAIVAADPHGGEPVAGMLPWLLTLVATAVVAAIVTMVGGRWSGPMRASAFALAGGVLMGAQSALLDSTTDLFAHGIVTALTSWQPYVMAVVSIAGLVLIQSAYQAGPLAASMPVLDTTEPAVAVVIGVVLFGEQLTGTPMAITVAVFGVIALLAGVTLLDTSPVVQSLARAERNPLPYAETGHPEVHRGSGESPWQDDCGGCEHEREQIPA